jgi:RNA recognition motif-containing protein
MTHTGPGGVTTSTPGADIIDTAIVIKNIPFSYPEETFREKLFEDLSLSPPDAFNYHRHRTDGVFRGLAFANFKDPNHALEAVSVLNKFKLEGDL